MTTVFIGIGSNIDRERHLVNGLDRLADLFGELRLSPVYESAAVGFEGPAFLNLVAAVETDWPVARLRVEMQAIERDNGYIGNQPKFSSRTLDLDLLMYGNLCGEIDGVRLPRGDILRYAYVLWPLAELAGDQNHPVTGLSFGELRHRFSGQQRGLRPVSFLWRGQELSRALLAHGAS